MIAEYAAKIPKNAQIDTPNILQLVRETFDNADEKVSYFTKWHQKSESGKKSYCVIKTYEILSFIMSCKKPF